MKDFINKFKIPTLLGMGIIVAGLVSGLYLVLKEQTFLSRAAPNLTPQNITFTNISEDSVVISWQTNSAVASFITFGHDNPGEQTSLDDKDTTIPQPRLIHYITLKNLLPKTTYQYKIISGKITSETAKFTTPQPSTNQTGFSPIIGSVMDGDTPLNDGIVYLSISTAATQSALIKTGGNFLIPISQIRKADLSDTYPLTEDAVAKITIISEKGEANMIFNLKANSSPLPPIKLGQNIDLTTSSDEEIKKFDLNGDGLINTADYAIILQNFGKNPQNKKADLNGDGVVDQKDLDLMQKQINQ